MALTNAFHTLYSQIHDSFKQLIHSNVDYERVYAHSILYYTDLYVQIVWWMYACCVIKQKNALKLKHINI